MTSKATIELFAWFARQCSGRLVDAGVKAAVVLALSALGAWLLRSTSAAVRHRVWCLGLGVTVLLPILSSVAPHLEIRVVPALERPSVTVGMSGTVLPESPDATSPFVQPSAPGKPLAPKDPREAYSLVRNSTEIRDQVSNADAERDGLWAQGATIADVLVWFVAPWIIGMSLVLMPLAVAFAAPWWVLRGARRLTDSHSTRLMDELSAKLRLSRSVTIFETRLPLVPMTCGVLRPAVIVPADWQHWPEGRRRCVLLHELAHVKRLDVLFQAIGRLACALYWFNPLVWHALRRMRIERELACDDCAIAAGERATVYAQQLIQIAREYRPARLFAAVAMTRSVRLEGRIVSLLDPARSHLPISNCLARWLMLAASVLVLALSSVSFRERSVAASAANSEGALIEKDDGKFDALVRGRVVDMNGQPLTGAKVLTIRSSMENMNWACEQEIVDEASTDDEGKFEIPVPGDLGRDIGATQFVNRAAIVLALADGYAPDWQAVGPNQCDGLTLKLPHDSIPIEGRVLDLEGRPIAGARLRLRTISSAGSSLDEWIKEARDNPAAVSFEELVGDSSRRIALFPLQRTLHLNGLPMFAEIVTNTQGRFRIPGLGPDRYVSLELEAPTIAKTWINAVTRPMQAVPEPSVDPRIRNQVCYGAAFDYSAEPTQPIIGVVRDAETKQPLAGMQVDVHQYPGSLLSVEDFVNATTDDQGRYRLIGLPKPSGDGQGFRLRILPGDTNPYFRTVIDAPRGSGLEPVTCDIELKRAVWLTGRVTNQVTGEPVQSLVSYFPALDNPNAPNYPNLNPGLTSVGDDEHYATHKDGTFRIPAISGRGVLMATGVDANTYSVGAGGTELGWRSGEGRLFYHIMGPEVANTVRGVTVDQLVQETVRDMQLIPLSRQTIRLQGPDGQPLTSVEVIGRFPYSAVDVKCFDPVLADADHVEVLGLEMDERRLILFSHPEKNLGKAAIVQMGKTKVVRLEPCASIAGRVVDGKGRPVVGTRVTPEIPRLESPAPKDRREWGRPNHYLEGKVTDAEGRFQLDQILSGVRYEILVAPSSRAGSKSIATDLIKPGESIDLGDVKLESDDDH